MLPISHLHETFWHIRCELKCLTGWKWHSEPERTCIQIKDNFTGLSVVLNSLFVPFLQMEVDADDKRHRTRSKGICTDTHRNTHLYSGWPSLSQHRRIYAHTRRHIDPEQLHSSCFFLLFTPLSSLYMYLTATEVHLLNASK